LLVEKKIFKQRRKVRMHLS